jgi:predicted amidohydrolase
MQSMIPKAKDVFRIGVYQGPTREDSFENNSRRTHEIFAEAHQKGIDFACVPECFLTGGCLSAKELQACAVSVTSAPFRKFVKQCAFGDMVSIVGFAERRGKHLHNSAAVIHRGRLLGIHRKSVAGGVSDKEANTFVSDFRVFRARGVTFGVIICFEGFFVEPSLLTAEKGARIIFEPHFSFIPMQGMDWQRQRVRTSRAARAVENDCWYVKSNVAIEPMRKVAGTTGLGYGDSFILDNIGRPRAEAGLFTVGWFYADAPKKDLTSSRESRVKLAPPATRKQIVRLYSGR